MTVFDYQRAFDQALAQDDTAFLLAAFLRLIVAVDQAVRWHLQQLQSIEPDDNPELHFDTVHKLLRLDMLAYVSGASDHETRELRHLLASGSSATMVTWYHQQWSARATTATDIIGSIASALRTAMTIIYGHIHLLRTYATPNARQKATYQQIIAVVDTLRACRNQLRMHLAARGIEIQHF